MQNEILPNTIIYYFSPRPSREGILIAFRWQFLMNRIYRQLIWYLRKFEIGNIPFAFKAYNQN